jgi:hypothetical protein
MKKEDLLDSLQALRKSRILLEQIMSNMKIEHVDIVFEDNPIFYDGCKQDPNETDEQYQTERYLHVLDMLSKTHHCLVQAQEKLMRLGAHYIPPPRKNDGQKKQVRIRAREDILPPVERIVHDQIDPSTSISPEA